MDMLKKMMIVEAKIQDYKLTCIDLTYFLDVSDRHRPSPRLCSYCGNLLGLSVFLNRIFALNTDEGAVTSETSEQ